MIQNMSKTEPITVLIVDDNKNNLFSLHTLIKEYINVNILEAQSGHAALAILLEKRVDLIILDVQMPEMDGFETAKAIRARKKTRHIPIVFLTAAYKSREFQQKGFAIGAADYLTKPIDTPQLINRIQSYQRFIEQNRQHKIDLESKVHERTADLLEANQLLKQEITERLRIEEALNDAKEVAETANLAKSQFLANMSHELRTPLNAIMGYTEMLKENAEELEHLEQDDCIPDLEKVHTAAKHLLGLINGVLDISKIEAGKMELFVERVDLEILINEVVSTIQPLIEKNANTLEIDYPDNEGNIQTDQTKLRQMLLNLLSNATKFTEMGTIRFKIERQVKNDGDWIIFSIADEGIGMTEAQLQKLFQPFNQADASTTRRYGGTGLGLAITKHFAEMMGGTLEVKSEFGIGSTFMISLPTKTARINIQSDQQDDAVLKGSGIILVIDDDAKVRKSLKADLSQLGYAVAVAADGLEGLKLANKLRPDAILLDVQMPDMDGWRILSMLKSEFEAKSFCAQKLLPRTLLAQIPVIMISMEEQSGYAMKPTDYMAKPLKRDQLTAVLEKYQIGDNSDNLVMLVDDEEGHRITMATILELKGLKVFQAENGQVALEHLERKKPTLILLDLSMPVMDGFEFLTHLQTKEKWRSIPVIVLTSKELSAKEQAHLNKSVETILNKKAFNQERLVWHIHELIAESQDTKNEN
ncbi:MAG: hybrid sensor histidine kinase/response regulator [Candidatus Parabeggiatoa sp. nov. 3]|nr:MAG: hybrid sensor histidine kinase/response regulator [Gammaproteobacteria bacterium]